MAQRVIRIDDLDQESTANQTVTVGLNGRWVELDLTDQHVKELEEILEVYFTAGRKPDRAGTPVVRTRSNKPNPSQGSAARTEPGEETAARKWCLNQGIGWVRAAGLEPPPRTSRGRLAQAYVDLYRQHSGTSADNLSPAFAGGQ